MIFIATKNSTMKHFVLNVIELLNKSGDAAWAQVYSKARMEFYEKYQVPNDLKFSTSHGIDFFIDILNCLNGKEWKENGPAGDSFRKLIKIGMEEEIAKNKNNLKETQNVISKEFKVSTEDLKEIDKLKQGEGN